MGLLKRMKRWISINLRNMFNKEVFEKMEQKFGAVSMPQICLVLSYMFEMGHEEAVKSGFSSDFDHDRDWWKAKADSFIFNTNNSNKSDDLTSSK